MMKRILVTGATGFVGANLARRLLRDGHEVHLLLRTQSNLWRIEEIQKDVQLHVIDMEDSTALCRLVREIGPEWIFHLAAYGAYSSQTDLNQMVGTNITSTMNLVNACLATGFNAFINTGSSSEYGFKDHAPAENEWLEPNSHYAVTKASATLFCRYTAQARNVHLSTLRLYSVYGPYEEPTRLIPTIIKEGLKGRLPPLVNPGIARDYVYVDDVCDAYVMAATRRGSELGAVYNVGSGLQTSLGRVVEVVRREMNITEEPVWGSMPNRIWDSSVWVSDSTKIGREIGWKASLSFEEGFVRTVEWSCQNPEIYGLQ